VVMAIKALLTNSGAADSILRRNKGRRKGGRSSFGPRTKRERPE
jgi:hypothetical protein